MLASSSRYEHCTLSQLYLEHKFYSPATRQQFASPTTIFSPRCLSATHQLKTMRAKSRMNSSRTFKRSGSTDQPSSSSYSSFPPAVEFPAASPQLILGEEITHFSHPHPLSKIDLRDLFTCAGCKEYGAGRRFACQLQCDYQLHDFCGSAPQTLKSHPLHHQHPLAFHHKPGDD